MNFEYVRRQSQNRSRGEGVGGCRVFLLSLPHVALVNLRLLALGCLLA
jgi:hypothetical protein